MDKGIRTADFSRELRRAHRAVEREMMRGVAAAGLDMLRPRHMTVLRVLDPGPGGSRISELARDADVSRQAIQQVVGELESLGIVTTTVDAQDARARRVSYTKLGRAGYERCMTEFARIERDLAGRVGARRMRELTAALRELAG